MIKQTRVFDERIHLLKSVITISYVVFHFITHDQVFMSKMTVLQLWGQGSKMIFFSIYPMLGQSVIDKV